MDNFFFGLLIGAVGFIAGYYNSMMYWYERAENGSLIEIKGSIYKLDKLDKLEKQDIKEKRNETNY